GGPDDVLVADARRVEAADRESEVVHDQLGDDAADAKVLRLSGRDAARDERKARALRGVEADEGPRPVQQAQADDIPVEAELRLGVLDEDQGAADLADVAERLDHRHRTASRCDGGPAAGT